jgi:hemerythrin
LVFFGKLYIFYIDKIDKRWSNTIMTNKTLAEFSRHKEAVTWSSSYSVGIKLIDDQHKGLLDFINDLFNHSTGNEKDELEYFREVIQTVVSYIKNHLSTEEKLLSAADFPDYAAHKRVHDLFTLEVIKSVKDFESGKRLVLEKFAYYLKDWLLTHIAVMDKQYMFYLKKAGILRENGTLAILQPDMEKDK